MYQTNVVKRIGMFATLFLILLVAMVGIVSAETWDESDFSAQEFNVDMTLESDGDDMKWIVNLSEIDGHWSTGAQIVINNSSQTFMLGRSPAEGIVYKEYNGGWSAPTGLPDGMNVIGEENTTHYEITVDKDLLGGEGATFCWAANVEATWPNHSSSEQQYFPANWPGWSEPDTNMTCTVVPEETPQQPVPHPQPNFDVPTATPLLTVGILGIALVLFFRREDE